MDVSIGIIARSRVNVCVWIWMSLCNFANMVFRQRYIRQWRMPARYLPIGENYDWRKRILAKIKYPVWI